MNAIIETAAYWVQSLSLSPHPEGGFYKEIYRSADVIPSEGLPQRFSGARNASTSIFYLLERGDFSAFHRIQSDELWHFYAGSPLELHILGVGGYTTIRVGRSVHTGEHLQYAIPAGSWFAATPVEGGEFSLLGCTVSPGFDFRDFEMAQRRALLEAYPQYKDVVARFTRES